MFRCSTIIRAIFIDTNKKYADYGPHLTYSKFVANNHTNASIVEIIGILQIEIGPLKNTGRKYNLPEDVLIIFGKSLFYILTEPNCRLSRSTFTSLPGGL
jgi:hypothetical protein